MSYLKSNLKLKITVFLIITALIFWLIPSNLIFAEERQNSEEEIVSEETSGSSEESIEEEVAGEEVTEEETEEEVTEEETSEEETAEEEVTEEEVTEEEVAEEETEEAAVEEEEVEVEDEPAAEVIQEETTALDDLVEDIIEDITRVSTNKEDYGYGEKVIITGKNYEPNQTFIIKVIRPDGTYVEMSVLTDAEGNFTYDEYSIDYAGENYFLTVSDLEGNTIDEIGFTDENIYVDQTGNDDTGDGTTGNPYKTITNALKFVTEEKNTIYVRPGTYEEQVIVNTSVSLQADPTGVEIRSPAVSQSGFKFAESSSNWEPIVFAYGGEKDVVSGVIFGTTVIDFIMRGFLINGMDDDPASLNRKAGILLRNVDGTITKNTVENISLLSTGFETFGIIAYGDSDLIISKNEVSGYSRGGIGANGDAIIGEPLYETPNVLIKNNTVTGPGMDIPVTWAPNGIQIGWGATGKIVNNTVSGNGWPGTDWTGSGIIVAGSDKVEVYSNTVVNNETGIAVCGWMWDPSGVTADNTWIHDNKVAKNTYGISIQDKSIDTTIENNTIKKSSYDGIDICNFYGNPPTGTVILSNTIIGNNTENDATSGGIWIDAVVDGDEVKINFNNIVDNNKFGILNTSTVGTLDASGNWWGSTTGPNNATTNPSGTGNAVSNNVDYSPWWGADYIGASRPFAIAVAIFFVLP